VKKGGTGARCEARRGADRARAATYPDAPGGALDVPVFFAIPHLLGVEKAGTFQYFILLFFIIQNLCDWIHNQIYIVYTDYNFIIINNVK
jgi:hypothetical protein